MCDICKEKHKKGKTGMDGDNNIMKRNYYFVSCFFVLKKKKKNAEQKSLFLCMRMRTVFMIYNRNIKMVILVTL